MLQLLLCFGLLFVFSLAAFCRGFEVRWRPNVFAQYVQVETWRICD
jgi:hypothetical protein